MSLQPLRDKRAALADAAALVTDGAIVALGGGLSARLPMALVRELVRQGRRGLHLVGSAHSIDVDMLVAAGAVRRCEESYVGFEQDLGLAPAYRRAAEEGSIEVAESCCVSILAQLRAAEMGLPFLPVRGVRGSDIRRLHPEYAEITCPFTGETLVAVPALRPDVALLHAPAGDRYGNLHLEQPYVLDERFASAARLGDRHRRRARRSGRGRRRGHHRPRAPGRCRDRGAVRRAPVLLLPAATPTTATTCAST